MFNKRPKRRCEGPLINMSKLPKIYFGVRKLPDGSSGCPKCSNAGVTSCLIEIDSETLSCEREYCNFTFLKKDIVKKEKKAKKKHKKGKRGF